jgi:hypothetical protein
VDDGEAQDRWERQVSWLSSLIPVCLLSCWISSSQVCLAQLSVRTEHALVLLKCFSVRIHTAGDSHFTFQIGGFCQSLKEMSVDSAYKKGGYVPICSHSVICKQRTIRRPCFWADIQCRAGKHWIQLPGIWQNNRSICYSGEWIVVRCVYVYTCRICVYLCMCTIIII